MIQRIQTVWLLLSLLLMVLFASSDLSLLTTSDGQVAVFSAWSVKGIQGEHLYSLSWLGVLSVLISGLILFDILLYKKRMLQIRVGNFIAFTLVGLILALIYSHWTLISSLDASLGVRIPLSYPIICLILQILAVRGIIADEMLVRMSRRLR